MSNPIQEEINKALALFDKGKTHTALDILHNTIDDALLADNLEAVDIILRDPYTTKLPTSFLIGILMITLPLHNKLSSRTQFFKRVRETIEQRDQPNAKKKLLAGLEGE